jgi:alpha-tubulin suppressor-like RCC1 family protein
MQRALMLLLVAYVALAQKATIYTFGKNSVGQLGDGTMDSTLDMKSVTGTVENVNIVSISLGAEHGLAIDSQGKLHAWGDGTYRKLGDGHGLKRPYSVLSTVTGNDIIVAAAAALTETLALNSLGQVRFMGVPGEMYEPPDGQYMNGELTGKFVVKVRDSDQSAFYLALTDTKEVYVWGGNYGIYGSFANPSISYSTQPIKVNGLDGLDIIDIETHYGGYALTSSGQLYTWGDNRWYEYESVTPKLIDALLDKKIVAVRGAISATHILTDQGKVYGWGAPRWLGDGTNDDKFGVVPITGALADKFVVRIEKFDNTFALTSDGQLYAWGTNANGELGTGDKVDRLSPTIVTRFEGKRIVDFGVGGNFAAVLAVDAPDTTAISTTTEAPTQAPIVVITTNAPTPASTIASTQAPSSAPTLAYITTTTTPPNTVSPTTTVAASAATTLAPGATSGAPGATTNAPGATAAPAPSPICIDSKRRNCISPIQTTTPAPGQDQFGDNNAKAASSGTRVAVVAGSALLVFAVFALY